MLKQQPPRKEDKTLEAEAPIDVVRKANFFKQQIETQERERELV